MNDQVAPYTSGGDETVKCFIVPEGIEIWTKDGGRQFTLLWSWLEFVKETLENEDTSQKQLNIIVERPQAEAGLKGYSQF
jgi:hypothetical protein